jgi:hypothetical protein
MTLTPEHRSLLMRSNRLLGATLVESNLVKIENLEAANERLLELIGGGDYRRSSVLAILAYELHVLNEFDVIHHVMDEHGTGLVDLRSYDVPEEVRAITDLGACRATWTVPFDCEEEVYFVATAYYLSPAVRAYWEKTLGGLIVWYCTSLEMLADYMDKIEASKGASPASANS